MALLPTRALGHVWLPPQLENQWPSLNPGDKTLSSTRQQSWASAMLGAVAVTDVEAGAAWRAHPRGSHGRTQPDGHPLSSDHLKT